MAAGNSANAQGTVTATAPANDTMPPRAVISATLLAGFAPLVIHLGGFGVYCLSNESTIGVLAKWAAFAR